MLTTVRKVLVRTVGFGAVVFLLFALTLRGHALSSKVDVKFRYGFSHARCSAELLARGLPGDLKVSGRTLEGDGTTRAAAPKATQIKRKVTLLKWTVYELKGRPMAVLRDGRRGDFWVYRPKACA